MNSKEAYAPVADTDVCRHQENLVANAGEALSVLFFVILAHNTGAKG